MHRDLRHLGVFDCRIDRKTTDPHRHAADSIWRSLVHLQGSFLTSTQGRRPLTIWVFIPNIKKYFALESGHSAHLRQVLGPRVSRAASWIRRGISMEPQGEGPNFWPDSDHWISFTCTVRGTRHGSNENTSRNRKCRTFSESLHFRSWFEIAGRYPFGSWFLSLAPECNERSCRIVPYLMITRRDFRRTVSTSNVTKDFVSSVNVRGNMFRLCLSG
jgi:hypothetical protein